MSQGDGEGEVARFERSVRKGRGAFGLVLGALAFSLLGLCAWLLFEGWPPRSAALRLVAYRTMPRPETTEEQTPNWVQDAARDEEGAMGQSRVRSRFGVEGPVGDDDPPMAREQAQNLARDSGIIGILKASTGPWNGAPGQDSVVAKDPNDWLLREEASRRGGGVSSDPMSALGALMGDSMGSTSGLGTFGTGRGGAPAKPSTPATTLHGPRPRARRAALSATLAGSAPAPLPASTAAGALLARYATLQGVTTIDAQGYFANTYVPGDPELRALQARLASYDRDALLPQDLRGARLEAGAQRNAQPFDPPGQAALVLFVAGSERGLTGSRRMLVQVGLQATQRRGGPRPAMRIALVVDARQALDDVQTGLLRELLASFARARQPGDELSLHVAGPGGGLVVAPDSFRLGPLTVALQTRLASRSGADFDLSRALREASARVRSDDEDHSLLGSSAVVIVTAHALGAAREELEQLARASALEGVPVSALGLGARADAGELSAIALAGQGSRRMLRVPADAAAAVEAELEAVAGVVARALRLRIRLAPGVQLVSVLGSRPLDAPEADDVRQAESAVDQRVARSLGIERDRGQDEEGVQILIPAFHAGDAHVVLLDVVVPGPGPVAEATVRFKDLVQLGNGVARANLALPNAALARGPLERNVLTNLFAHELAGQLAAAGDAVAAGSTERARELLGGALAVLQSVGAAVPELVADRALAADRALLAEYEAVLAAVLSPDLRAFAADSLHFASRVKLGPRPEGDLRAQL